MRINTESFWVFRQYPMVIFIALFSFFASASQANDVSSPPFTSTFKSIGFSSPSLSVKLAVEGQSNVHNLSGYRYHLLGQSSDPLVILLGGGPGFSSWNLEPIQQRIQMMGFQVLLMDMVGVGENKQNKLEANDANYVELWIEQIHQVQAKIEKPSYDVILVGHSWGALMAMLYAREYPQRVSKMILLNPVDPEKKSMQHLTAEIDQRNREEQAIDWDDEDNWEQKTAVTEDEVDSITLKQIQQVLPTYFLNYDLGKAYAKQFTVDDFEIDVNVQAWNNYDENPVTYQQLKDIDIPLYFLECQQDYLMPYNLNAFRQSIQLTQVELIEQCGHFPWIEKPKEFYQLLSTFLNEETHNE